MLPSRTVSIHSGDLEALDCVWVPHQAPSFSSEGVHPVELVLPQKAVVEQWCLADDEKALGSRSSYIVTSSLCLIF